MIAARRQWPGQRVARVPRAAARELQPRLLFDDDEQMREILAGVPGVDADAIIAAIDSPEVLAEYEARQGRDADGRRLGDRTTGQGR